MGAKTWMLAYADGNPVEILKTHPPLDREASAALARKLFPSEKLKPLDDGNLSNTCPPDDELLVGCFPALSILAAHEFGIDYPSQLAPHFLDEAGGRTIYLQAMHSVVDWSAFAVWSNGELKRSLSLSPDSGILEDIGPRLPFEVPYWAGEHPALDPDEDPDDYPFRFHPLEFGEAVLGEFFGYQLEGPLDQAVDPETIPLARFKRSKPWWKAIISSH